MKNKTLQNALAIAIVISLVAGATGNVHAVSPMDGISTIVEKLAQKFGLKQADVQSVFDEVHTERQKERQAEMTELLEARLTVAVINKKITEAQKTLILKKHAELQAKRASQAGTWQNLTPEERQNQAKKERAELEAWAKQNGIDTSYLMGRMGMGGRGKGMGGWMK